MSRSRSRKLLRRLPWFRLSNALLALLFAWAAHRQLAAPEPAAGLALFSLASLACASLVACPGSWLPPAAVGAAALLWSLGLASQALAGDGLANPLGVTGAPGIAAARRVSTVGLSALALALVARGAHRRLRQAVRQRANDD